MQCRFTGSARRRPGNPVVSYSPVRGFYDQVVARYHQTGRYNGAMHEMAGRGFTAIAWGPGPHFSGGTG